MDPVTHTLSGIALGNAFFRGRVGPKAVPIMAAAANLPDIDAIVELTGSPMAITWRRTFGHSILLLPLWAAGFAWLARKRTPELRFGALFAMGLAGSALHLFFDLINSFGVVPLWPASDWRPELSIVFIVDLILTGLLAAPLLLSLLPPLKRRLIGLSRASLALVAAYFMLCGSARAMALTQLGEETSRLGVRPDFLYMFPEPLGPHRWRGVMRAGDIYRVYLARPFSGTLEPRGEEETMPNERHAQAARDTARGRRLDWFAKAPVWTARPAGLPVAPSKTGTAGLPPRQAGLPVAPSKTGTAGLAPRQAGEGSRVDWEVSMHDLRFSSLVLDRAAERARFSFRFRVRADGGVETLP